MKLQDAKNAIIVPWDFSDLSRDGLWHAQEMVDDPSLIRIVHVTQSPSVYEYGVAWEMITDESIRENIIESFQKDIGEDDRFDDLQLTVLFGDPGKRICEYAKECNAELIIMPSHGRSGFTRLMLGSVAERVVRFSPCPVLILRHDNEEDGEHSAAPSDTKAALQ